MKIVDYIIERLSENSTWRGLVLLSTALGVVLSPEQIESIIATGLAIIGTINVFRKSPKPKA